MGRKKKEINFDNILSLSMKRDCVSLKEGMVCEVDGIKPSKTSTSGIMVRVNNPKRKTPQWIDIGYFIKIFTD